MLSSGIKLGLPATLKMSWNQQLQTRNKKSNKVILVCVETVSHPQIISPKINSILVVGKGPFLRDEHLKFNLTADVLWLCSFGGVLHPPGIL